MNYQPPIQSDDARSAWASPRRHAAIVPGWKMLPLLYAAVLLLAFESTSPAPVRDSKPPIFLTLDSFENYADSAELGSEWINFSGNAVIGLETNIVCSGHKALRLGYSPAAAPFTNLVARIFASEQNWSGFNVVGFSCGATPRNTADLIFQILDPFGGVLGTFLIPRSLDSTPCTDVSLDLSVASAFINVSNGTDLHRVGGIAFGMAAGPLTNSGVVYFDNLTVGYDGNLISNPGFQDINHDGNCGDGWGSLGAQQFQNFFPNLNSGHATFYSGTTGNWGGVTWPSSLITVTKFRLTLTAASDPNWNAQGLFGIQFLAMDNSTVLKQKLVPLLLTNTGTANYKSYSMSAIAPGDATYLRPIILYTNSVGTTGNGQRAEIDNVVLKAETNRVLSIFGSSVATGLNAYGTPYNYYIKGSVANSYGSWLTWSQATNGWRVVNQSVPGDTTPLLTARFYRDELPVGADVVFIGLSLGNEGLPGATNPQAIYNQFYSGTTNLIAMSRANNLLPMVGGGYPRNTYSSNEYTYLKSMDLLLNTLDVPSVNFLGATDDGAAHWPSPLYGGDAMHPSDAGHYEMFLCFVPSVFEALMAGKPTPRWSDNRRFLRIIGGGGQPSPLTFRPNSTIHSFTVSFRVRASGLGTIASITLPNSAVHPTLEIIPSGFVYVATNGQTIHSGISAGDGAWHEVVLAHQYVRGLTWLYVDSVPAGTLSERLTPIGFVLGGHGLAATRPDSPAQADYENWFVHRSVLNAEEVRAQFTGALQQASLEVYAPLDDGVFIAGRTATNCAQSLSQVLIEGANLSSQSAGSIRYQPGRVSVDLNVTPNRIYEAQRAVRPDFQNYTVLLTTNATTNVLSIIDTNPPQPSGFYRAKQN